MVIFENYIKKSEKSGQMKPRLYYFKSNFSALPNNLAMQKNMVGIHKKSPSENHNIQVTNNSVNKNFRTFYYVQKSILVLKNCKAI